jgi:hypothetical protein
MWHPSLHSVILLAVLAISVFASTMYADGPEAKLLTLGDFHGSEVGARSRESWLGVTVSPTFTFITEVRLTVETVRDIVVDSGSACTGKRLTVANGHPTFLLRNIDGVGPGAAETALSYDFRRPKQLAPGESLQFMLHGSSWSLTAESLRLPASQQTPSPVQLVVHASKTGRTVVRLPQGIDAEHARGILWIGDINDDHQPDFLIDISDHYNVLQPALFLSTRTSHGWQYRLVAYHRTSGC